MYFLKWVWLPNSLIIKRQIDTSPQQNYHNPSTKAMITISILDFSSSFFSSVAEV